MNPHAVNALNTTSGGNAAGTEQEGGATVSRYNFFVSNAFFIDIERTCENVQFVNSIAFPSFVSRGPNGNDNDLERPHDTIYDSEQNTEARKERFAVDVILIVCLRPGEDH